MTLYPAQEEAILELLDGKHLVLARRRARKSLVAFALHFKAMPRASAPSTRAPSRRSSTRSSSPCATRSAPRTSACHRRRVHQQGRAHRRLHRGDPLQRVPARGEPARRLRRHGRVPLLLDKERGVAWQVPLLVLDGATFLLMSRRSGHRGDREGAPGAHRGRSAPSRAWSGGPLEFEYSELPLHERSSGSSRRTRRRVPRQLHAKAAAEQAQTS